MKLITTLFTVVALLGLSAGQPKRHARHVYRHGAHGALHHKRNKLTVTDETLAAPTEFPEVVIYVDQFGNPVRTVTETVVHVNPTTPTVAAAEDQSTAPPPDSTPAAEDQSTAPPPDFTPAAAEPTVPAETTTPPETTAPAEETQPPSSPPAAETSQSASNSDSSPDVPVSSSGGGKLHGVSYSPYKRGGCKSAQEVQADFELFAKDHGVIRLYGVDCDQVPNAYAAAKKYGNKLFLGVFDISEPALSQAVSAIAAGVENDWSIVDTVSVGNELVNNGQATSEQAVDALGTARSGLRAAGYEGPVVIVDTFVAALANPVLCEKSDYCAVNVHPFFDPNTPPSEAGAFVTTQVGYLREKLSGDKRVVVTETGWPWNSDGGDPPTKEQQSKALSSIKTAFSSKPADVILFTAFNDYWKADSGATKGAEKYWGLGGQDSPADPA